MLISRSPWPLLISLNLMNTLIRLIFFFYGYKYNLGLRIFSNLISFLLWFKDMNSEYNVEGFGRLCLEKTIKFFFLLFITSEVIIFVSIFWAYYCFFFVIEIESRIWPSYLVKPFGWTLIPIVNTLILISSRITLTMSHNFININNKKYIMFFLVITIVIGLFFTILQLDEYRSSYYSINDGNYGSIFFLLTGLHGLHVIIGSFALLACLIKINNIDNRIGNSERFEISSWYWHFVDLVWIFVLYSLYYLN